MSGYKNENKMPDMRDIMRRELLGLEDRLNVGMLQCFVYSYKILSSIAFKS